MAAATGLDRLASLHLQLSYMRSAAWSAPRPGARRGRRGGRGGSRRSLWQRIDSVLTLLRAAPTDDARSRSSGSELSSLPRRPRRLPLQARRTCMEKGIAAEVGGTWR